MGQQEIPYGYTEEGKIFLKGWNSLEDREIGQIKNEDIPASVKYFTDRFEELEKKIRELEEKIESSENKGSFQMQLKHLRDSLPQHDGLGDYPALDERLAKQINLIEDLISKNRQRNTDIKNALLAEMKEAVEIVNWREATEQVQDIKARWIKTGNAEEEINDQLETGFWQLFNDFYERKQAFYEDKQKLIEHYKGIYESLISEAKGLSELDPTLKKEKEAQLKDRWKENGAVPAPIYKPLIKEFNSALRSRKPTADINAIIGQMESAKQNLLEPSAINFRKIHNELKNFRPGSTSEKEKKTKAYELLFYLQELDFVYNQCSKRRKNFASADNKQKKTAMIQFLRELLDRDKVEMKTFEENSLAFKSQSPDFNRMMEKKMKQQQQKIRIKESILSELNS